jgi:hypothetical protein
VLKTHARIDAAAAARGEARAKKQKSHEERQRRRRHLFFSFSGVCERYNGCLPKRKGARVLEVSLAVCARHLAIRREAEATKE